MPRMVASAPNRIVISNMITTYGGIEPTGLPPRTIGQSYDMYRVIQAPMAQPAMPPIKVNMRTGLTGWSSASSISCRGIGEYTVKSVWPPWRSLPIASTVASRCANTPRTPGVGGGWKIAVSGFVSFTRAAPYRGSVPGALPSPRRSTPPGSFSRTRSEEHTSELQSQSNLVCRLLLEKKKKTIQHASITAQNTSNVLRLRSEVQHSTLTATQPNKRTPLEEFTNATMRMHYTACFTRV